MSVPALLPSNATAFEEAVAAGMSDTLLVPIREIMDPARTPERFLPFLAAHRGVKLWFDDWPVARKRLIISEWPTIARMIGTRAGTLALLAYVDAELLDIIAHPAPFALGHSPLGRTPLGHPAFTASHLIRVRAYAPPAAMALGRTALGRCRVVTPSDEPYRRVLVALRVAKAPETEYRVDFGHHRPWRVEDNIAIDAGRPLGAHLPRTRF